MTTELTTSQTTTESERFQTGSVLTLAAGHTVHDTYTAFLAPLLPLFISNFGLSKTEAGLLSVFMQGPSLSQPFIGRLADRISLRTFVVLAPAVAATAMSLLGVAPSYAVLALLLFTTGVGSAFLHAVAPVMAGRMSGRSLGRGMSYWMVGGELARTLGPILIVTAVQLLTLRGTPWLMIGGLVTSAVLYFRLQDVSGRPATAATTRPWREALRAMRPFLVPLTGLIVARSFMSAMLTTYLPTFLNEQGAGLWSAGAALSVLEGAGVIGALIGGSLSDRLGRKAVLLFSMVTTPVLIFVFITVSGSWQWPLLILLGLTSLSVAPVIMALVQESYPDGPALANGIYMALSFVLRSGVVVILGAIGDFFGLRWAFVASAIIALLGSPLILLLPVAGGRKRRGPA
jgi:FSR family fosmidomycin resistance protein-like MFS transporter